MLEQYISKYILKLKDKEEKKDNLNFHSSLSNLLMELYYNSIEQSVYNGDRYYYSYVVDGKSLFMKEIEKHIFMNIQIYHINVEDYYWIQ